MNSRERIIAALNGQDMDRMPICEIGVWPETERRWRTEGMPADISLEDYFNLDKIAIFSYNPSLMLPKKVLEENEKYIISLDGDGNQQKVLKKDGQSPPHLIKSSVTVPDDWMKLRHNLKADIARFEKYEIEPVFGQPLKESNKALYEKAKAEGTFTVISPSEPCWYFLMLLGEEDALCTIALDPDFAEQIFSDYTDFVLDMLKTLLSNDYRFDALWVFSDMCYKNGMLFSPEFFHKHLVAYQKRIFGFARENGMKVIYHCDGYVGDFIPLLLESGVDCVQPLEVRAGNDIRQYIDKYQDTSFIGNINADVLASGKKESIYEEVSSKVQAAKNSNRYIFHSDHSVPVTVSLEDYKYAIELANQFGRY